MRYLTQNDEPAYLNIHNHALARRHTREEIIEFLKNDKTDELKYHPQFRCADFAEALHNNAEKAGFMCFMVYVGFENDDTGHMLNAFPTKNEGLLYTDSCGSSAGESDCDKTVDVKIGIQYCGLGLDGKTKFTEHGIINRVDVYW
jgi:hypothetical protein